MALFIELVIDKQTCVGISSCGKCVKVCPVQIFAANGERPVTQKDNLDECTLCNLCLQECEPQAISIKKLYDN